MNVFELFAKLGLDTTEYDKGLDNSEKKGANFGKGLKTAAGVAAGAVAATTAAVGAGAKAFLGVANSVSSMGDTIGDNAAKMGISTKAYQEWDYILQRAGTSIEAMKPSMKTLANAAVEGKDAFDALGISQEEIASLNQEELFERTITALQGVSDEQERTALASKLLGRGAIELGAVFSMTAEETEAAKQKMYELGNYMDEDAISASDKFQDTMADMNDSIEGVKTRLMVDFLPSLTETMGGLSKIFSGSDVEGGLAEIEKGISGLASNLVAKAPQIMQIGGTILKALLSSITSNLPVLLNAAVPVIMEIGNGIISAAPDILTAVMSLIGTIGSALADPANLQNLLESAVAIVLTISNAISENAPTVIPAIVEIIMQMLTALTDESVLMPLLSAGLSVIVAVVQGILKAIPVLIKNLPAIISNITNFLVNSTPLIISAAIQLLGGIISAIPEIIVELGKATPQIISSLVSGLLQGTGQIVAVGGQLLAGLWQGISDKTKWLLDRIKGFGESVLNGIKGIFGIHSPSTVFRDEVGKMLALGLGEGFEKGMPGVVDDMVDSAKGAAGEISDAMSLNGSIDMERYAMKSTGGFNTANSQFVENLGAMIDKKLSNINLTIENPVYIGQRKIDQQVKTATARNNVISGGR